MALPDRGGSSVVWRRSTFCTDSGCVEVAFSGSTVLVRDSDPRGGQVLKCSGSMWRVFLRAAMTEMLPGLDQRRNPPARSTPLIVVLRASRGLPSADSPISINRNGWASLTERVVGTNRGVLAEKIFYIITIIPKILGQGARQCHRTPRSISAPGAAAESYSVSSPSSSVLVGGTVPRRPAISDTASSCFIVDGWFEVIAGKAIPADGPASPSR